MSKTLRRDKVPWWNNEGMIKGTPYGFIPVVKGVEGLKCRRDWTCKPGCFCKGPSKRERMKKIRREASLDINEQL